MATNVCGSDNPITECIQSSETHEFCPVLRRKGETCRFSGRTFTKIMVEENMGFFGSTKTESSRTVIECLKQKPENLSGKKAV